MSKRIAPVLMLAFALNACEQPLPPPDVSHQLIVATRQGPTTYYTDHTGLAAGFEHDLVSEFARANGWTVRWQEAASQVELFNQVQADSVHLAAAALSETVVRENHLLAGPVLFETPVQVIYRNSEPQPQTIAALAGKKIAILDNAGHNLGLLRYRRKFPKLSWTVLNDVWPEELLARLDQGEFDAVIVNGMDFDLARTIHPGLGVAFDLGEKQKIVWALPKNTSLAMLASLGRFIDDANKRGLIQRIIERYYGHAKRLDSVDVIGILDQRQKLLSRLRSYFQEAQSLTGIDWRLLAAIGYQESKWNPYATSPTGVRGIMMLTGETADRMGITNRLDARQSILGGARYLALMKDALPARIPEPDRTWIALAAYNQGQGHIEDARRIAQARGEQPDSWAAVKQALPLLARGGYSSVVKYGYARGAEALIFAENIRSYYDILLRLEPDFLPYLNISRETTPRAGAGAG
jgi:membrane-bound lytic murein transglycosylase F